VFFTVSIAQAWVFQVLLYGWPFAAAPLLLELARKNETFYGKQLAS
jgi:hypothetical protein